MILRVCGRTHFDSLKNMKKTTKMKRETGSLDAEWRVMIS